MVKDRQTQNEPNDYNHTHKTTWQPIVNLVGSALFGLFLLGWFFYRVEDRLFGVGFLAASVNWFILLGMFFQAHITRQQWRAMRKGLRQNKRMIKASQRQARTAEDGLKQAERSMQNAQSAYVVAREIHSSSYYLGKPFIVAMDVVNTGNTPAYKVRVFAHLDYQTVPFKFTHTEAKESPLKATAPATIGPNGDVIGKTFVMTQELTWDDLEQEKTKRVHFWGLITYEDIFGRERWTEFSHRKIYRGQVEIADSPKREEVEIGMNSDNNNADPAT